MLIFFYFALELFAIAGLFMLVVELINFILLLHGSMKLYTRAAPMARRIFKIKLAGSFKGLDF
jgi:hypothetical protein